MLISISNELITSPLSGLILVPCLKWNRYHHYTTPMELKDSTELEKYQRGFGKLFYIQNVEK